MYKIERFDNTDLGIIEFLVINLVTKKIEARYETYKEASMYVISR